MAKFSPHVVAQWIEHRWTITSPTHLLDVITHVLSEELSNHARRAYSDEEIAEIAEELVPDVADAVESNKVKSFSQGIQPPFLFDAADYYYSFSPSIALHLRQCLYGMTAKGFEYFCARILKSLGGIDSVSGGTNDGCVDFYAFGLPLSLQNGFFPTTARLFVVGQAKRWCANKVVTVSDLREFVGAVPLRLSQLRIDHPDRLGVLTPVSLAYWVTSDFCHPARKFAEQMGLWHLNGNALSQLALLAGVGPDMIPEIEADALRNGPRC